MSLVLGFRGWDSRTQASLDERGYRFWQILCFCQSLFQSVLLSVLSVLSLLQSLALLRGRTPWPLARALVLKLLRALKSARLTSTTGTTCPETHETPIPTGASGNSIGCICCSAKPKAFLSLNGVQHGIRRVLNQLLHSVLNDILRGPLSSLSLKSFLSLSICSEPAENPPSVQRVQCVQLVPLLLHFQCLQSP